MKRNKAFIALALSSVMALSVFAGCGSSEKKEIAPADTEKATEAAASEEAAEEKVEDTVADSAVEEDTESVSEDVAATSESEEKASKSSFDTTIEEQVLVDANDIKITAKSLEEDEYDGAFVKLLIENNSDQDINVDLKSLTINDFSVNGWIFEDVAAGKKSNAKLELGYTTLQEMGIENIGKIEVSFDITEADTYDDIMVTDVATIETSKFAEMDTTVDEEGYEMYNADGIRIVGQYVDEGDEDAYDAVIVLYIENNTERNIMVDTEDVSINGFMLNGAYLYSYVGAGKKALPSISIDKEELADNDIESIDEVELKFEIRDADSYDEIVTTEPIGFTAS